MNKDSGKVIEHYQEFAHDNLSRYCLHCKRQRHDEDSCCVFYRPDDNSGEGKDSRNNLGVVKNARDATTFNSNNEENLQNKGKMIEVTRRVLGKMEC